MSDSIKILQELKLCYDMIEIIKKEPQYDNINNELLRNLYHRIDYIKNHLGYSNCGFYYKLKL